LRFQLETMTSPTHEVREPISAVGPDGSRAVLLYSYFTYMTFEVLLFLPPLREKVLVVSLNLLACATVYVLEKSAATGRSRFLYVARDWLPCILILVAYREAGLLFTPDPSHRLDYIFIRWDEVILRNSWVTGALSLGSPWLQRYLEFSYFLCYPVVPLGVATLYLARASVAPGETFPRPGAGSPASAPMNRGATNHRYRSPVEHYWTAVLMAALTCYVLFPLFPLTPPRELFHDLPGPYGASGLRGLNHWLLDHYAVGASLFPSGHVAAATAAALVIRRHAPLVGLVFLLVALSIALATIYGRYHYAADALAGTLVGIAGFLVSQALNRR
jgi:membrane-associated phospholipid phosphatase